jgi:hypothetical protein
MAFLTASNGGNKETTVWFQWVVLLVILAVSVVVIVYTIPVQDNADSLARIETKLDEIELDGGGSGDHSNLSGVYTGYFNDGTSNFRANFTLSTDGNVSLNSSRQSFEVPTGGALGTLQPLAPSVGRWSVSDDNVLHIILTSLGQDATNAQERRTAATIALINGEIPLSSTVAAGSGLQSIRFYAEPNSENPTSETVIAALNVYIVERLNADVA